MVLINRNHGATHIPSKQQLSIPTPSKMPLILLHPLCKFFIVVIIIITPFLSPTLTLQLPLFAPLSKDNSTHFYTLSIYLKTPLQPTKLHLHLGSSFTWLLCDSTYNSSSSHHIPCNSSLCASFHSSPNCFNNTCALFPENPLTRTTVLDTALIDSLSLPTSDGSTHGPLASIPNFVFSCSTGPLLHGLATNANGLVSLGRSNNSLPAQISAAFFSSRCFALCLPGSSSQPGAAFFGSTGPYYFSSKIDLSKSLNYTPLLVNPVGDTVVTYNAQPSDEYFVNLTSIRINGVALPINASILTVDENGFGGTKISTADPYTVLESSVYKLFVDLFVNQSSSTFHLTVTEAVEPFSACYRAEDLTETRVGPAVPTVDLVMHSDDVFWRVFGGNSMVRIENEGKDLWCLGFVDGGSRRKTSVVIGGYQMEDNLVQFDLESNRFGFTSSLLLQDTTCTHLNVTDFAN